MARKIDNRTPEEIYDDFWKEILENSDGTLDLEQLKKELSDFYFIIQQLPSIYSHVTGGMLSKHMYYADQIIAAADDHMQEMIKEAVEEEKQYFICTECGGEPIEEDNEDEDGGD